MIFIFSLLKANAQQAPQSLMLRDTSNLQDFWLFRPASIQRNLATALVF
jgi:hypothetical protein